MAEAVAEQVQQQKPVTRPLAMNPQAGSAAAFDQIRKLGLLSYVAELDAFGYTVIPPELSGGAALVQPLLKVITKIATERNNGIAPDFKTGATHSDRASPAGQHLFYLLGEDPVFQKAMTNPVVLAFVRYLLPDAMISSVTSMLKGPGCIPLSLHSDQPIHPIPRSLVCNATYLLTDYTRDNGALCFVPGSHKLMRQPTEHENFRNTSGVSQQELIGRMMQGGAIKDLSFADAPGVVPIEAPKGSVVVWHGNTWHGAFNRTATGLRVNCILYWCSQSLRPQEPYREQISDDVLAANNDDFAVLVGKNVHNGWMSEGPEYMPGNAFATQRKRGTANGRPAA